MSLDEESRQALNLLERNMLLAGVDISPDSEVPQWINPKLLPRVDGPFIVRDKETLLEARIELFYDNQHITKIYDSEQKAREVINLIRFAWSR